MMDIKNVSNLRILGYKDIVFADDRYFKNEKFNNIESAKFNKWQKAQSYESNSLYLKFITSYLSKMDNLKPNDYEKTEFISTGLRFHNPNDSVDFDFGDVEFSGLKSENWNHLPIPKGQRKYNWSKSYTGIEFDFEKMGANNSDFKMNFKNSPLFNDISINYNVDVNRIESNKLDYNFIETSLDFKDGSSIIIIYNKKLLKNLTYLKIQYFYRIIDLNIDESIFILFFPEKNNINWIVIPTEVHSSILGHLRNLIRKKLDKDYGISYHNIEFKSISITTKYLYKPNQKDFQLYYKSDSLKYINMDKYIVEEVEKRFE